MRFKSILVVVTNPSQAETAITAAAQIALANDGHLDVLAVGLDHTQLGYSYIGAGAVLTEFTMEQAEKDARLAEIAAKKVLGEQPVGLRWTVETAVAEMGGLGYVIGNAASFADLVVQTKPYGKGQGLGDEAVIEAALFDARAPVLILPLSLAGLNVAAPKRIVLAWNQSQQALTATKQALPFLQAADRVDVTVIDPPVHGPERSDPGGMLCQYLVRHGVRAEVTVLARSMPSVAQTLAQHAMDVGAEMLVMGAYGHSRLREAVLGGATRDVLEHSVIPVLMAH